MLLVGSLTLFRRQDKPMLTRNERTIIIVLAFHFTVNVVATLIHLAPLRKFDALVKDGIQGLLDCRCCT